MSNIQVTPPAGVVSTGQFKFVVADAESSNNGESLTFVTNGGAWSLEDQVPPTTGSIYPTASGTGTATFVTTGVAGTVGAYIMGTLSPTTVNVQLVAGGLQGVMLAVQFSTVVVNKQITGPRANAADQFTYRVQATSNAAVLSSATSTGAGGGPFGAAVATLSSGVATTVVETMAAGSVSNLAQYTSSLNCTNSATGSSTVIPSNQPVTSYSFASTSYGDAIACTFTNTAKPATVALRKITAGAIGGPFSFAVTNLASAPAAISTTSPNTATPAVPTAINVTIQAADDISCTITNNGTPTPLLVINKTFSTAPTPVNVGQTITYTYSIANTGNVVISNVQISDMHGTPAVLVPTGGTGIRNETLTVPGPLGAGASPDGAANNGIWSTLAPGATVQFNYVHTVTQAEIDNG